MAQLPPDSQAAMASQLTPPSAFAVPVPMEREAIGANASAPAMVASPNVLRMFFNFDPFAKRAPRTAARMRSELPDQRARGLGRTVSVGYDSRGQSGRRAFCPIKRRGHAEFGAHRSPAHTQV